MVTRVRQRPARAAGALGALCLIVAASGARLHPVHTTMSELTYDRAGGAVVVKVRVYVDDFAAAAARHAGTTADSNHVVPDAVAFAYTAAHLALADRSGRRLALQWCGSRRQAEVLWICLRSAVADLRGLQVRNTLMFDRFEDQVNILQVVERRRRRSLLFTKGDGFKPLP